MISKDLQKRLAIEQGKLLKELRIIKKISQQKLAGKLGISYQQIQKYESGVDRISLPVAVMICSALSDNIKERGEMLGYISSIFSLFLIRRSQQDD